jgi:hypothetical protein
MKCYSEFPLSTVVYNLVTLGGALLVSVVTVAQSGPWATAVHLLLLALTMVGVLATVCTRCGYYGRRCALGLGKVVVLAFKKGQEDRFFRTTPQFVVLSLLALLLLLPIGAGIVLLIGDFSAWWMTLLAAQVGLLLAGLIPHARLVCGHCCQGECGACPIGRRVWKVE